MKVTYIQSTATGDFWREIGAVRWIFHWSNIREDLGVILNPPMPVTLGRGDIQPTGAGDFGERGDTEPTCGLSGKSVVNCLIGKKKPFINPPIQ